MNTNIRVGGPLPLITKTKSMPPNAETHFIWNGNNNGSFDYYFMNFSCALLPGIEVGYGYYSYEVNVSM